MGNSLYRYPFQFKRSAALHCALDFAFVFRRFYYTIWIWSGTVEYECHRLLQLVMGDFVGVAGRVHDKLFITPPLILDVTA
jgi:hypothetical protein